MNMNSAIYQSKSFNLQTSIKEDYTKMRMSLLTPFVTTNALPKTIEILNKHLPDVFKTRCFNNNNYTFYKEAKNTEIAHLFEHILLEYLYQEKKNSGERSINVTGKTRWNWQKNNYGTFEIYINVGKKELDHLKNALKKAIRLIEKVLASATIKASNKSRFSPSYI